MAHIRRLLCLALVAMMSIPLPGAFSDWTQVAVTPDTSCAFLPGGGTCSTGLRVPVDGILKDSTMNVTGLPSFTNHSVSLNASELWSGAAGKANVSSSPDGIGLGGFGSWWEESASEMWGRIANDNATTNNWTLDAGGYLRLIKEFEKPYVTDQYTVGLWHFDEGSGNTAKDSSGNVNDGIINGPQWTDGMFKKALSFDGLNDYVSISDSNSLDVTGAITIDVCINLASYGDTTVISKMDGNAYYISNDGYSPGQTLQFLVQNGTTWDHTYVDMATTFKLNKWYHITGSYTGSYLYFYVDGTLLNSTPYSGGMSTNSASLLIGAEPTVSSPTAPYFNGMIDEIRISNIARDPRAFPSNATLLSPILNSSSYSRVMVQGDFPNGTNYTVDILDPATNNTTLQKGLRNGDELPLSLWSGLETPYRNLVMRLNVNTSDANVTPTVMKWGVGTGHSLSPASSEEMNGAVGVINRKGLQLDMGVGVWNQKASGATPRTGHTAVWDTQNNQMLVFGGSAGAPHFNDLWAYSPSSNSWTQKASGATLRQAHTAVWDSQNNQMLVFGGTPDDSSALNDLWAYNPSTDTWTQKASGATKRYLHTAVWDSQNNQMLVFGGRESITSYFNELWAYSPSTNSWTQKASGTIQRGYHTAVWDSQNNQMLVFGGEDGSSYLNDTWAYTPANDTWTQKASGATPRDRPSAVWDCVNSQMIVFGGAYYPPPWSNDVWAYCPSNNTWTQRASGATQRYGHTAVWDSQNNQMLMFGGHGGSSLNDTWAYKSTYLPSGSLATVPVTPFIHTYGNLFVNATTPTGTGYWVNVSDTANNTLQPYLKNGDSLLVNASKYPKIRLNLTLWTNDINVTPVVHEWGYGAGISPFGERNLDAIDFVAVNGNWTRNGNGWKGTFTQKDLNNDGYLDIVFSNYHDSSSYNTNSYIYWGSAGGYSIVNRTGLPTIGTAVNSIADLNGDGYFDIVFCNQYDGSSYNINSYIYWGSAGGYSPANRTDLPTNGAIGNSIADLNGDGYPDIVFSNYLGTDSYIYWGSAGGYSPTSRTNLPTSWPHGNSIADLNGDGYLDIVFSNCYDGASYCINSYIYWGSSNGYSSANRASLPTMGAGSSEIADLNGDGYLDIVFGNMNNGSTYNVNSYIYWGSAYGFSIVNKTELPAHGPFGCSVADLNNDGHLDIVFSNYFNDSSYAPDSYIYWGSTGGFSPANRTDLPTIGAMGNTIEDLNRDGYLDIVFSNEWDGASFIHDSYIYWGSPGGFSVANRTSLPTLGAYGNSIGYGAIPSATNDGTMPLYPPSLLILPNSLKNVSHSVEVKFVNNPKYLDGAAGVLFGYQNQSQYHYAVLKNYDDKIEVWEKMWNRTAPVRLGICNFTVDENITYKLALDVYGNTMKVYVNGTKYLEVNETVENGCIGFMTSYATAEFNNLRVSSSSQLAVTPTSLSIGPIGKTPSICLRISPDNSTWSSWINITSNRSYYPHDFTQWGPYLQYNITLNTINQNATPVLSDIRIDYYPYLLQGALSSRIAASPPEGRIIAARPVLNCTLPPGMQLTIGLSADNGTTWENCQNNTWKNFTAKGTALRWRVGWTGDGNGTPLLKGLAIDYNMEHYPSEVSIDIGSDSITDWSAAGILSGTMPASNLTAAINSYVEAHRSEADANRTLIVPVTIQSATGGIVKLGDAAVDIARFPKVIDHSPTGTSVALDTPIMVSFSEPMNASSVMITVNPDFASIPTFTWSLDRKNVSLTHSGLVQNTTYNVTVLAGALSERGAALRDEFIWDFATVSQSSVIAPRVIDFSPHGTDIPLTGMGVSIGFNKPMNHSAVEASITIEPLAVLSNPIWDTTSNQKVSFVAVFARPSTRYNVTINTVAADQEGYHLVAPQTFNFTTAAATIPVDSPKIIRWSPQGTGVAVKPTITISFDREMDAGSVFSAMSLQPYVDISSFFKINLTSFNFTLGAELDYGTRYNVTVTTTARSLGNSSLAIPFMWDFTTISRGQVDSDLPQVRGVWPLSGATGVAINETVKLLFSEAMNKTATAAACSISPRVNGSWVWMDKNGFGIEFTHTEPMLPGKYIVTISPSATDESGNHLDGNGNGIADGALDAFTSEFTVPSPPGVRPTLRSKAPTGANIGLADYIVLTFDKRMNLSSVQAAFVIQPNMTGAWDISQDGKTVTFSPSKRYQPGKTYSVTLRGTAADETGLTLGSDVPWSFTTAPAQPTVKGEFPWWILLVMIVVGIAGGIIYWRSRQRPKDEEPSPETEEEPEEPPAPVEKEEEDEAEVAAKTVERKAEEELKKPAVAAATKPKARVAPEGFAVEDIFLMYRDGRLIQHSTRRMKADMDVDIMTSMLKAVQDFVKESLGAGEGGELGSMEYGGNKILLEKGKNIIVAAVIEGGEPEGFRDEICSVIRDIESEFGAVLPEWNGSPKALAGAKKFMARLGDYAPAEKPLVEKTKDAVSLKSELEFYQGFVRLKVAVKNSMPTVIRGTALKLVFNEKAFRLDHVEPEYEMEGRELLLEDIEPREKKTVAFFLDPQICTESSIEGVLNYKDAHGNLETMKLSKKLASVVCPIVYTDENINTAMLKRMAAEELDKKDTKVFSLPQAITPQKAFDLAKSAIQHHDARLVREFTEKTPFVGEAWYYGKAKGREDKLVIRTRVMAEKGLLEFFVASSSTLMLTGMLAELKSDLNKELNSVKGKPTMKQVTKPEEVDAMAQIRTLLDMEFESESKAEDTEIDK